MRNITLPTLVCFILASCASSKYKNVSYLNTKSENEPQLSIYKPRKGGGTKFPVLIFVHGGNWNSGNKKTYGFFGRNFAKKGVVTVIPDYTLSPNADVFTMTKQIAAAINWTKNNINNYGGDTTQIFVTGHSAGGHLVALATMNPTYGIKHKTVKGIILNDAAGLDMAQFLKENPPTTQSNYLATWSDNPQKWMQAAPINYLSTNNPNFLIYMGTKTYNSIKTSNEKFIKILHPFQPDVKLNLINKKHIPMIAQYIFPWNKRYREIIEFMEK